MCFPTLRNHGNQTLTSRFSTTLSVSSFGRSGSACINEAHTTCFALDCMGISYKTYSVHLVQLCMKCMQKPQCAVKGRGRPERGKLLSCCRAITTCSSRPSANAWFAALTVRLSEKTAYLSSQQAAAVEAACAELEHAPSKMQLSHQSGPAHHSTRLDHSTRPREERQPGQHRFWREDPWQDLLSWLFLSFV